MVLRITKYGTCGVTAGSGKPPDSRADPPPGPPLDGAPTGTPSGSTSTGGMGRPRDARCRSSAARVACELTRIALAWVAIVCNRRAWRCGSPARLYSGNSSGIRSWTKNTLRSECCDSQRATRLRYRRPCEVLRYTRGPGCASNSASRTDSSGNSKASRAMRHARCSWKSAGLRSRCGATAPAGDSSQRRSGSKPADAGSCQRRSSACVARGDSSAGPARPKRMRCRSMPGDAASAFT